MKHSIKEIYTIVNGTERNSKATKEYLEANGIPCPSYRQGEKMKDRGEKFARTCSWIVNSAKDSVYVLDVNGPKEIFMFGEKTWFDTLEEREEYRKQYHAERNAMIEKNKIKKEIIAILDNMEKQDLEILLAKLS